MIIANAYSDNYNYDYDDNYIDDDFGYVLKSGKPIKNNQVIKNLEYLEKYETIILDNKTMADNIIILLKKSHYN